MLRGWFRRITLQIGKIKLKIYFLILNIKFFFHLLTNNSFVPYKLCDILYKVQKKAKKYVNERELSNDISVWKDFRPPYVLEAI